MADDFTSTTVSLAVAEWAASKVPSMAQELRIKEVLMTKSIGRKDRDTDYRRRFEINCRIWSPA
jgi:hypothetical protein